MSYLMSGQLSELERLEQGARMWEPAGKSLLSEMGTGVGLKVLDVGCGCMGWLRLLSIWVGQSGSCVGSDLDDRMLAAASDFAQREGLSNVELVRDDLFDSALPLHTFDLVHARFQMAPLGRFDEQLSAYLRLLKPGGILVLEDPDSSSWRFQPSAPGAEQLIGLIKESFKANGGDFDAGRRASALLVDAGYSPKVRADVLALQHGHPYLQLPLQFATSLRPKLLNMIPAEALDDLVVKASAELSDSSRWGLSFTLVQTWAIIP